MFKDSSFPRLLSAFNLNSVTRLLLHADIFWFCNVFDEGELFACS